MMIKKVVRLNPDLQKELEIASKKHFGNFQLAQKEVAEMIKKAREQGKKVGLNEKLTKKIDSLYE